MEGLGVHSPEHPTLTPVPSQEFVQRSIEREAVRRIFWLIHLLDVMASIYFKKPVTFADNELRLRLPVDETSFELGVHSTLPGVCSILSHLSYYLAPPLNPSSRRGNKYRPMPLYPSLVTPACLFPPFSSPMLIHCHFSIFITCIPSSFLSTFCLTTPTNMITISRISLPSGG